MSHKRKKVQIGNIKRNNTGPNIPYLGANAGYPVGLPGPGNKQKPKGTSAQGSDIYAGTLTTGFSRFSDPRINTQLIARYEHNAIIANPVKNLARLMFKGEPKITIFDPNGEEDPDLSATYQALS